MLPIGVGYLGWQLDKFKSDSVAVNLISVALENRVQAVWFAFGADLGRWVKYVRDFDQKRSNGHNTLVFVQVSSVEESQEAVSQWKVDAVVAQGA